MRLSFRIEAFHHPFQSFFNLLVFIGMFVMQIILAGPDHKAPLET